MPRGALLTCAESIISPIARTVMQALRRAVSLAYDVQREITLIRRKRQPPNAAATALASLLQPELFGKASEADLATRGRLPKLHFPAKAKNVKGGGFSGFSGGGGSSGGGGASGSW